MFHTQGNRPPVPESHLHAVQEKSAASTSVSLFPLHGQGNENAFTILGGQVNSSYRMLQSNLQAGSPQALRVGRLGHGNLYLRVGNKR